MFNLIFYHLASSPEVIPLYCILSKEPTKLEEGDYTALGQVVTLTAGRHPDQADLITADGILSLFVLCGGLGETFRKADFRTGYKIAFRSNQWADQNGGDVAELLMMIHKIRITQAGEMQSLYSSLIDSCATLGKNKSLLAVGKKRFLDMALQSADFETLQPIVRSLTAEIVAMGDAYQATVKLCNEFATL